MIVIMTMIMMMMLMMMMMMVMMMMMMIMMMMMMMMMMIMMMMLMLLTMIQSKIQNLDNIFLQQAVDDNRAICVNFSDAFVAALRGNLQGGTWQGIDIRCSQQEEQRSLQGAFATFHLPPHLRSQQQARREHTYESLTNNLMYTESSQIQSHGMETRFYFSY